MEHQIRQLEPLYRRIMGKIADDAGAFLKPELFCLVPPEDNTPTFNKDGSPAFLVSTAAHPQASSDAASTALTFESQFRHLLQQIATAHQLGIEQNDHDWDIMCKDAATFRHALDLMAEELGISSERNR